MAALHYPFPDSASPGHESGHACHFHGGLQDTSPEPSHAGQS